VNEEREKTNYEKTKKSVETGSQIKRSRDKPRRGRKNREREGKERPPKIKFYRRSPVMDNL